MQMLEKLFHLKESGTNIRTEVLAGLTTFFAMAYIIFVNPSMLSYGNESPQVANGVFFATCIAAAIGTLLMAFLANLPFAQAPGMGMNALFAFTAMPAVGFLVGNPNLDIVKKYQGALAMVMISGILFILITVIGLRESIIEAIPRNIKHAISGGIGIFLCFLGLKSATLVVDNPDTLTSLVKFSDITQSKGALIALFGLAVIAVLSALKIHGALIIGILSTTALSYIVGFSHLPESFSLNFANQAADFLNVSFLKLDFSIFFTSGNLASTLASVLAIVISLSMVDMFDSLGSFIGAAEGLGIVDENGNMPNIKKALLSDAIATTCGAALGTSTVTTYVESATGIGEGGRTGLTSVVTGIMFILALVAAPFVGLVPACATAPALIYVGYLMLSSMVRVDFKDVTEAIPAFLTIVVMPFASSIADGIAFGVISYVVLKLLTGRVKEIRIGTVVVALLFIFRYFLVLG